MSRLRAHLQLARASLALSPVADVLAGGFLWWDRAQHPPRAAPEPERAPFDGAA